ncbi:uncharacterized protein [Anabrus simplex]|uniref:uncharacterized protein n=1 Tax=Anabrus simplex TaxID=316456 RepID=UPI0035A38EA5
MDLKVEIKEEPVWFEGTSNTSLENSELVTEIITVKQETKSELTEPGPLQENLLESPENIKEEIFTEQHTVDQSLPFIQEENKKALLLPDNAPSHPNEEQLRSGDIKVMFLPPNVTSLCRQWTKCWKH